MTSNLESYKQSIYDSFSKLNIDLATVYGKYNHVQEVLDRFKKVKKTNEKESKVLNDTLLNLQEIEKIWHEIIIRDIENFVSEALTTIFNEQAKFSVEFDRRGDSATAEFSLEVDGVKSAILDGKGGGYVNVIAFLLRLMLLVKTRPLLAPVLFLDESFSNVSAEYVFRVGEFLRSISEELGVQIVLITHRPELAEESDVSYNFSRKNNKTIVTRYDRKDDVTHVSSGV